MTHQKKIRVNIRPDQFGCSYWHFNNFIKGKELKIINEYSSMVTIEDESGEQWNIFSGNYTVSTGLNL